MANKFYLVTILICFSSFSISCYSLKTIEQKVKIQNPGQFVTDARKLMGDCGNSEKLPDCPMALNPDQLLQGLQIENLRYASVYKDHVSFALSRTPDYEEGVRVWSQSAPRTHADRPTSYPDVYFYSYQSNSPESSNNIP